MTPEDFHFEDIQHTVSSILACLSFFLANWSSLANWCIHRWHTHLGVLIEMITRHAGAVEAATRCSPSVPVTTIIKMLILPQCFPLQASGVPSHDPLVVLEMRKGRMKVSPSSKTWIAMRMTTGKATMKSLKRSWTTSLTSTHCTSMKKPTLNSISHPQMFKLSWRLGWALGCGRSFIPLVRHSCLFISPY